MDYITIAEYANRAGVSKQTAYNRAKAPHYKGYFRKIKGVLMVDVSIFEINDSIKFNSRLENGESGAETERSLKDNSSEFSSLESELIEMLKSQIAEQNKRIDDLFSMLSEKDKLIAQITASVQQLQHERNLLEAGSQVIGGQSDGGVLELDQEERKGESKAKKGLFSIFKRRK